MKADYYRYISEYAADKQYDDASSSAKTAYSEATTYAEAELKTTNPVRLGLALNYSVFCYEVITFNIFNFKVMNDPPKACNLAKQAFDDAIADIEHIDEDQYKDATTIMQLIRDNLTLWTSELEGEGEDGEDDN